MKSLTRIAFALPLLFSPALACGTASDDATAPVPVTAEDALRALTTPELLGAIDFGQTKSTKYTYVSSKNQYRAYSVTANAGDTLDVTITSSDGGDARIWILSSTYATLASTSVTAAAHLVKTASKAGTYYVVFRDKTYRTADFDVTLAPRTAPTPPNPNPPPPATTGVDPFDDALSAGTPIAAADAKALFAAGATRATLGHFVLAQRTRTCNATTGCAAWVRNQGVTFAYDTYELWNPGPGWSEQKSCFQVGTETWSGVVGDLAITVNASGQFAVELSSAPSGVVSCANVTAGNAACGTWVSSPASPTGQKSCNLPNPAGAGADGTVYPATVPLYDSGNTTAQSALNVGLLVTSKYVYARMDAKSATDASGSSTEIQYSLYGSMKPGETPTLATGTVCTPTTCAAQGKNCGTVPDGCGGMVSCGGCDYPYTCGADNTCAVPAGCNLQPCYAGASVGETCCGSGQVTCANGQGCTCYDACF
jgi:hypothetical protein